MVERAREDDISLFAAGLGFYALVSAAPLIILILWIVGLVLGESRLRQLAQELARIAPKNLGVDRWVQRVANLGTRLGVVAAITALWPATAYGSGLRRAFDRLTARKEEQGEGLRGRGLLLLVLMPVFVLGTLAASFGGTLALGHSTFDKVVGFGVALATGFVAAGLALILIYRIFPPIRLNWGSIARASATAAAGISVISALLVLYLNVGANFQKHYATSGLAALILVAVWLFLSNVLLLVGYKIAQETK